MILRRPARLQPVAVGRRGAGRLLTTARAGRRPARAGHRPLPRGVVERRRRARPPRSPTTRRRPSKGAPCQSVATGWTARSCVVARVVRQLTPRGDGEQATRARALVRWTPGLRPARLRRVRLTAAAAEDGGAGGCAGAIAPCTSCRPRPGLGTASTGPRSGARFLDRDGRGRCCPAAVASSTSASRSTRRALARGRGPPPGSLDCWRLSPGSASRVPEWRTGPLRAGDHQPARGGARAQGRGRAGRRSRACRSTGRRRTRALELVRPHAARHRRAGDRGTGRANPRRACRDRRSHRGSVGLAQRTTSSSRARPRATGA